jgi:sugar phosphate isomerase/epimerase
MLSRRDIVKAGLGLAMGVPVETLAAPPGVDLKCGVQLWTLKDDIRRDYEGTLREIAKIGLRRVELFELGGRPAAQTRAGIKAAGLECISAHVRLWELDADLNARIESAHQIGIHTLVVPVPWMPPAALNRALNGDMLKVLSEETTLDNWKRTAELLNSYGEKLHGAGLALAYHNHNIDFKRFGNRYAYEVLVASTDPHYVRLEMDCGWVASAGLDCTTFLNRWPSRYMGLHVKDVKAGFVPNVAMSTEPIEVGSGVMDWPSILQAAYTAGVREYYIEQEGPVVRPPLESVKIGFDYLTKVARAVKAA